jgi:hypothetical protein
MVNKINQNNPSQIEKANAILIDLRPNITPQDRDEAQKELNLSEPTITRYLNGEAKKIETALDMIEFFQRRILERDKKLQGVS